MSDFLGSLREALSAWGERHRLVDLGAPLLGWLIAELGAERGFFFTVGRDGGYRMRASRKRDGETIPDPERWISHYVVRRALEEGHACYFPDTRLDRRFRTEGEVESGVRARSILALPVRGAEGAALVVLDSRHAPMTWQDPAPPNLVLALDVLAQVIRAGLARERLDHEQRRLARENLRLEREARAQPPTPQPRRRPVSASAAQHELDFRGFQTRSAELIAAVEETRRLAASSLPILIEGESGTGKEVLARALHAESGRRGPLVSVHCGSVPTSLVEVELFGHERGAFTGAERARVGLFEQAAKGTILLDDVEEMASTMQLALLRVLETGAYRPVSSATERQADVRVMSTSRQPIRDTGQLGELREDLYYRLAGASIRIPPLRERREDILLLARHMAQSELGNDTFRIAPATEEALLAHEWPGNARELHNLIRRAIALGARTLTPEHLQGLATSMHPVAGAALARGDSPDGEPGHDIQSAVDRAERDAIARALLQAGGNKSEACKLLGVSRKTLYRRLERLGMPL